MNRWNQKLAIVVVAFALVCTPGWAAAAKAPAAKAQEAAASKPLPASPRDLVKRAIEHQLDNTENRQLSSWTEKDIKGDRTVVKQMVETPKGVLGRVVSVNGKPLAGDDLAREDARVNRLLNPDEMQKKAKEQKEDEERTVKMLRSLPDAFDFSYAGTETNDKGATLAKVNFTPKPDWDPPCRECLVFEGMQGTMVIDVNAEQIAMIDGTLIRDVNIGWGIIGHLDQGGRFVVEQQEVYPKHWDQTHMLLNFNGKALFFKTIKIRENSTAWNFHPVQKMDVKAALEFLKTQASEAATTTAGEK